MDPARSDTGSERPLKRQKTIAKSQIGTSYNRERYTIAWICALHIEMAAARAMMDEIHDNPPRQDGDTNSYMLGRIHDHNIVIACLPADQYGTNNAANVLANMMRTFPNIHTGLMVGIGGGVPSNPKVRDLHLGDVVVGSRIMQCDFGKLVDGGKLQRTAVPKVPHISLRTNITNVRARHEMDRSRIPFILQEKLGDYPHFSRPKTSDVLFRASYKHAFQDLDCSTCDPSKLEVRKTRAASMPAIHYGGIASGNQVMRDATLWDEIARDLDIICFEMEAAGLMDALPCLSIRGICDYSDSHKNKDWQRYAAATASAYAREFLELLPAQEKDGSTAPKITPVDDQHEEIDRRQRILDLLRFEQIDSRKSSIKTAHSKTCQWILQHPDYQAWLRPGDPEFLWIKGKPGAGKSTLLKFLHRKMHRNDDQGKLTASFFFNARGSHLEKTVSGMYRSLLLRILEKFTDIQRILDDIDLIPRNPNECPSVTVLKDLFRNAVDLLDGRQFTCFIDALDECDEQQVMDMVAYYDEMAEYCREKGIRLQICFSSRHYPYIDVRQGTQLILEDQPGHTGDLERYIQKNLRIRDSTFLAEIQTDILNKAAGVFLWVVLVVDILNEENRRGALAIRNA